MMSSLYTALGKARANTIWKPILEVILSNFSAAEIDEVKELKESESASIYRQKNVLFTTVSADWTTGVQVLLEKGVDRYQKIDERTTLSIFDVAAQTGDFEMQAILSKYGEENDISLKNSMAHEYPSWWFSTKTWLVKNSMPSLMRIPATRTPQRNLSYLKRMRYLNSYSYLEIFTFQSTVWMRNSKILKIRFGMRFEP